MLNCSSILQSRAHQLCMGLLKLQFQEPLENRGARYPKWDLKRENGGITEKRTGRVSRGAQPLFSLLKKFWIDHSFYRGKTDEKKVKYSCKV